MEMKFIMKNNEHSNLILAVYIFYQITSVFWEESVKQTWSFWKCESQAKNV